MVAENDTAKSSMSNTEGVPTHCGGVASVCVVTLNFATEDILLGDGWSSSAVTHTSYDVVCVTPVTCSSPPAAWEPASVDAVLVPAKNTVVGACPARTSATFGATLPAATTTA